MQEDSAVGVDADKPFEVEQEKAGLGFSPQRRRGNLFAARRIPELECAVTRARGDPGPIQGNSCGGNSVLVTRQRCLATRPCHVPDAKCAIMRPGNESAFVRSKVASGHNVSV